VKKRKRDEKKRTHTQAGCRSLLSYAATYACLCIKSDMGPIYIPRAITLCFFLQNKKNAKLTRMAVFKHSRWLMFHYSSRLVRCRSGKKYRLLLILPTWHYSSYATSKKCAGSKNGGMYNGGTRHVYVGRDWFFSFRNLRDDWLGTCIRPTTLHVTLWDQKSSSMAHIIDLTGRGIVWRRRRLCWMNPLKW